MAGTVSGLQGVEYHGGGACADQWRQQSNENGKSGIGQEGRGTDEPESGEAAGRETDDHAHS